MKDSDDKKPPILTVDQIITLEKLMKLMDVRGNGVANLILRTEAERRLRADFEEHITCYHNALLKEGLEWSLIDYTYGKKT